MKYDWIVVNPEVLELLKKVVVEDETSNQRFGSILRGPTLNGIRIYVDEFLARDQILASPSLSVERKTPLLRLVEGVFGDLVEPYPLA
jgi:hypothetical protein